MKGWIYIISNKAMPGLVKIGYSRKDPSLRAKELDGTASPHPHQVTFAMLVENPSSLEKIAHKKLARFHEGKEWFNCDSQKAISIFKLIAPDHVVTHEIDGVSPTDVPISQPVSLKCSSCKRDFCTGKLNLGILNKHTLQTDGLCLNCAMQEKLKK